MSLFASAKARVVTQTYADPPPPELTGPSGCSSPLARSTVPTGSGVVVASTWPDFRAASGSGDSTNLMVELSPPASSTDPRRSTQGALLICGTPTVLPVRSASDL